MTIQKVDISFIWEWDLLRQTPNNSGRWNDTLFTINKESRKSDFWVIYDDVGHTQSRYVAPENTILFTAEPMSFKTYPKGYTDQFGLVVTPRSDIIHSNILATAAGLPWFTGRKVEADGSQTFISDYDSMKPVQQISKPKLASIISSNKSLTNGHAKRLEFAKAVDKHFSGKVDLFGRGINEVKDKTDVLAPYRYHIVLENSQEPDYWTEKLSDAFLNQCYPIYHGCPNINDYFSPDCLTSIDIDDLAHSLEVITRIIESDLDLQCRDHILKAKQQCLDDYNLFPLIERIINMPLFSRQEKNSGAITTTIRPQKDFK